MKKKLLFIVDNLGGGVESALLVKVNMLQEYFDISIFTICKPTNLVLTKFKDVSFLYEPSFEVLAFSLTDTIKLKNIKVEDKLFKVANTMCYMVGLGRIPLDNILTKRYFKHFNSFDVVCLEVHYSYVKEFIASLNNPKKIMWIHFDYVFLKQTFKSTLRSILYDKKTFLKYDNIVCLSENLRLSFIKEMPFLKNKVVAINNFIDASKIKKKAEEPSKIIVQQDRINIITVARLAPQKNFPRIIRIINQLAKKSYLFKWYIVGEGDERATIMKLIEKNKLHSFVEPTGHIEEPFSLIKQCDIFVLFSNSEGTPVAIEEALVLGVPVIANKVGGIKDQITDGVNGILVNNDEQSMLEALETVFNDLTVLERLKDNARNYEYDNNKILEDVLKLFS